MAVRAQALYDRGWSARETLAECYGVELPDEIFAIADSGIDPKLPDYYQVNQPWRLTTAPGRDPVPPAPHTPERYEKAVADLDPDLLPLVGLDEEETRHGDSMLCYRLSDLATFTSADFRDTTFVSDASFWHATFIADAYFDGAIVGGKATFASVKFDALGCWGLCGVGGNCPYQGRCSVRRWW